VPLSLSVLCHSGDTGFKFNPGGPGSPFSTPPTSESGYKPWVEALGFEHVNDARQRLGASGGSSQPGACRVFFFLHCVGLHSVRFTGAQGVHKCKIVLGRGEDGRVGVHWCLVGAGLG
jgi:hypothetical protein